MGCCSTVDVAVVVIGGDGATAAAADAGTAVAHHYRYVLLLYFHMNICIYVVVPFSTCYFIGIPIESILTRRPRPLLSTHIHILTRKYMYLHVLSV